MASKATFKTKSHRCNGKTYTLQLSRTELGGVILLEVGNAKNELILQRYVTKADSLTQAVFLIQSAKGWVDQLIISAEAGKVGVGYSEYCGWVESKGVTFKKTDDTVKHNG